jgi:hypothetical protein
MEYFDSVVVSVILVLLIALWLWAGGYAGKITMALNNLMGLIPDPATGTSITKLEADLAEMERQKIQLRDEELPALKNEIEALKSKRKIEDEEIQHMLKMRDEKAALEKEKYEGAAERKTADGIAEVKNEYAEKLQERLEEDIARGDTRFEQILERLPSANLEITEDRNASRSQAKPRPGERS